MKKKLLCGLLLIAANFAAQQGVAKEITPPDLPETVRVLYHADKNCFNLNKAKLPQRIITDDLGEGQKLYIIPCHVGAYNIFSKIFITRDNETEEVFFADFHEEYGWTGTNLLVNIGYDPKTRRLTSFNKSAGHGWCGSSAIWRWKSYDFQMITFTSWDDCADEKAPEDWPVRYQKK